MERPSHAFPMRYPPQCAEDPFSRMRMFDVTWMRKPAMSPPRYAQESIEELSRMFASKLNLKGDYNKPARRKPSKPWNHAEVTIPPRAPHPALIRPEAPVAFNCIPAPLASRAPSFGITQSLDTRFRYQQTNRPKGSERLFKQIPTVPPPSQSQALAALSIGTSSPSYPRSRVSSTASSSSSIGPDTPPLSPTILNSYNIFNQHVYDNLEMFFGSSTDFISDGPIALQHSLQKTVVAPHESSFFHMPMLGFA
jgi:hypothetical protein